jgi:hypothetical protein
MAGFAMKVQIVEWLDNRSYQQSIDNILNKLIQNLELFVTHTGDLPFGYSERSLVGQLAIASHDCRCSTLQDYDVSIKGNLPEGKKNRYRPDLWLKELGINGRDFVFEVKGQDYMPIDVDTERIMSLVNRRLLKAKTQLSEHGQIEGRYMCALVAIKISCSIKYWERYGKNARSYNMAIEDLKTTISSIPRSDFETKPDFRFSYLVPFKTVSKLCKKNEKGQEQPPLVGVSWFGLLKQNS